VGTCVPIQPAGASAVIAEVAFDALMTTV